MPSTLYLDAARMGRMAPSAQLALQDFVRLAGEEGCTLYFERFLRDGFSAGSTAFQSRFSGLHSWGGVAELKSALAEYVGLGADSLPLLAGRSTNLVKLAARLLFRNRGTVLVTDLTWPCYVDILQRIARKMKGRIECLRVRDRILHREISPRKLVEALADHFHEKNCTGLLVPHVSHDGIRLPADEIAQTIRQVTPGAFMVIDGSQALGQFPVKLSDMPCDFYLGGCHKWLGSHLPLGIGFCPNPAMMSGIQKTCTRLLARRKLDDPLLAFLHAFETGKLRRFTETVNLSPLFALRGALKDQFAQEPPYYLVHRRVALAEMVARIGSMTGWTALLPDQQFRSSAVLLQATCPTVRRWSPHFLRERFHDLGVALTCYRGGIVRLSVPCKPLTTDEAGTLIQALALIQLRARDQARRHQLLLA